MSRKHEELMRRYAEAWTNGDSAGMYALMADDIVLHIPGRSPIAGVFKGKDDLIRLARIIREMTDRRLLELHELLVGENHAVALVRERMARAGVSLDLDRVFVFHLSEDAITEIWIYDHDSAAVDELWA